MASCYSKSVLLLCYTQPMGKRGSSLAGAVCVIAVALLAVLTVGTSSSVNVQMLLRSENAQTASLLADSAIQQALAELMKDPTWGNTPTTKIEYAGAVEGSSVQLTFNKTLGVPYSTRNDDENFLPAWPDGKLLRDGKVPGKRVHLVAVARCRNVTRTREAVVYVPNFTLSLGATGKVRLIDSVVGCLDSLDGADLEAIAADPSKLKPGDLGTNSTDAQAAVLERGSRVAGNLQAGGGISVLDNSTVGGEVRSYNSQLELPHFDFSLYDPARDATFNYRTLPAGMQGEQHLSGMVRCNGPSVTINGDLHVDNTLLFIEGNLKVVGGIKGTGAVIVTGTTTVEGGSGLTSADSVALLSQGDLTLASTTSEKYQFQGLVYTRGNFHARNFTVVGGFIADGLDATKGNIDMEGCLAIRVPVFSKVNMYYPLQINLQFPSMIDPLNPGNTLTNAKVDIPGQGPDIAYGKSPVIAAYVNGRWTGPNGDNLEGSEIPQKPGGGAANNPSEMENPGQGALIRPPGTDEANNSWRWWQPVVLQITREHINGAEQFVYYLIYQDEGGTNPTTERYLDRVSLIARTSELGLSKCRAYYGGGFDTPPAPEHEAWYRARLPEWEQLNAKAGAGESLFTFSFDPNRFLKESDKLRLSAWTEY
jgi:hypothetical protein